MVQKYLSPAELSQRWGGRIKVNTLANWRSRKTGPAACKINGKRILYSLAEVERWERENMTESCASNGECQRE